MVRFARENLAGSDLKEVAAELLKVIADKGLGSICGGGAVPVGLALHRPQEICACFNRY